MPKKNKKKSSIAKRGTGSVRLKAPTKKKVTIKKAQGKKAAAVKPQKKKVKTIKPPKKKAATLVRSKKHPVSALKKKTPKKTLLKIKKQGTPVRKKPSSATTRIPVVKAKSLSASPVTKASHQQSNRYLSDKDRGIFRELLLKWRHDLVEGIDETMHQLRDEEGQQADFNDRATVEEEFALQLKNQDRERRLISKIDQSLRSIDMNEYGYCEKCGEEIGIGRLKARPTATLCIECKTLSEIKERQFA